MTSGVGVIAGPPWGAWLGSIALGGLLGGLWLLAERLGAIDAGVAASRLLAEALGEEIGPVWVPMALVAARVLWLAGLGVRTRLGWGPARGPLRPALARLAPLFAALGLCGTVWGLRHAFAALGGGDFLARLPELLAGLGAAMTSTLVGLGLQIGTLLVAAGIASWSTIRVQSDPDGARLSLDGRVIGSGPGALEELIAVVAARQPEALRLVFAPGLGEPLRVEVARRLWEAVDAHVPIRELGS